MLIFIALGWLGAIALSVVFARGGFMFFVGGGTAAQINLAVVESLAVFLLFGWLIPLSIGVLRQVNKKR